MGLLPGPILWESTKHRICNLLFKAFNIGMWGLGPILIVAATGLIGMWAAYPSISENESFSQPISYYFHLVYSLYAVTSIYFHYVVAVIKDPGYYSAREVERWWIRAGYSKGYYDGDLNGLRRVEDVKREKFINPHYGSAAVGNGVSAARLPSIAVDHGLPHDVVLERTGVGAHHRLSKPSLSPSDSDRASYQNGVAPSIYRTKESVQEGYGSSNNHDPPTDSGEVEHSVVDVDSSIVELVHNDEEQPRVKAIVVPPGMRWCKKCETDGALVHLVDPLSE
ncbi:hypothetical protein HDU93_007431 [Gonapodya sp. JEL0774]|nr:hypothetical protein HDU93_007431 [Gonapodya sp. JEL0774]